MDVRWTRIAGRLVIRVWTLHAASTSCIARRQQKPSVCLRHALC
uniref:Uncharacterized protein n=1 Tax=Reovirus type 3 (strain Dearing) TaxID=10886 RepID=Q85597_REOVD|nr:hypothetical protein [Mammalian orthoreovirus 3 Dearing]